MRNVFAIALAGLLIGGCSDQSKMESACKGLAEAIEINPQSMSYNEISIVSSEISQADLESAVSKHFGDKSVSPESKRYFNTVYGAEKDLPRKYWINVDYTADGNVGKERSNVMCTFVDYPGGKKFLANFSSGGQDFYSYGLDALFMGKKLPKSLGGLFELK